MKNSRIMKKFMITYYAPADAIAQMGTATEEEKMAGMAQWMKWKDSVGDALIDFGNPLMNGEKIGTDGSFSRTSNEVSGYSIMQGDSIDAIKDLVASHPHLQWTDGCSIEVHECIDMG